MRCWSRDAHSSSPQCAQVEEKALSKEKDKASQERLAEVRKELAALEDKLRPLMVPPLPSCPLASHVIQLVLASRTEDMCGCTQAHGLKQKMSPGAGAQMRYEQEKRDMEELRALQKKREELRVKLKEAEARYDLAMVADLRRAPAAAAQRGAGEGQAPCKSSCRSFKGSRCSAGAEGTHKAVPLLHLQARRSCMAPSSAASTWRLQSAVGLCRGGGCHVFLDIEQLLANMPYASCPRP